MILAKLLTCAFFLITTAFAEFTELKMKETQIGNYFRARSRPNPALRQWALLLSTGEIYIYRRSDLDTVPYFARVYSVEKSFTSGLDTALAFFTSKGVTYLMVAAKGSKTINFLNYRASPTQVAKGLVTDHTNDIQCVFQVQNTDFLISTSKGLGQLKKWSLRQDGPQPVAETSSLTLNEVYQWDNLEDGLIGGRDTTLDFKVVDSTTMAPTITISVSSSYLKEFFRYKKAYPAAQNEILMTFTDGTIKVADISTAAFLKDFPSPDHSYATISEFRAIDKTKFVIFCMYRPICFLANPLDSPSGSLLPQILKLHYPPSGPIKAMYFQNEGETMFYVLKQGMYTLDIKAISICGGAGCGVCSADYLGCETCRVGDVVVNPLTQEKTCLSECPQKDIKRVLKKELRCVDCLREASVDPSVCNFTKTYFLKQASEANEDIYSSKSIEISFEDSSELLLSIPDSYKWNSYFTVRK